jgi:UPF0716 protein FxsA
MFLLLLFLFIAVPLIELYVIIQVGQAIGVLWTIALLMLSSVLGVVLVRSQGRSSWRRFRAALADGRAPAGETVDGAFVLLGGALMIVPGFVTDALGALLLLPPSRALLRRGVLRDARLRMFMSVTGAASRGRTRQDYDVDATAREIDPPILPR